MFIYIPYIIYIYIKFAKEEGKKMVVDRLETKRLSKLMVVAQFGAVV